jgi:23S rRNA (cytosine1962-C5)-methyltransferase
VLSEVLAVAPEAVFFKTRQRKEGRAGQYQKLDAAGAEFPVQESGLRFLVNLTDYLDTGLFLDHRTTRGLVREEANGKRVLNLFCYTGSFSVYALAGGASRVVSVDLSKTYLAWTERNVALNFPGGAPHETLHADVLATLKSLPAGSFDLIVLDPPTFSNSKRMEDFLDIQRDHPALINDCLRLLSAGGVLYFSTNFTKFQLEAEKLEAGSVKDITRATTPFDFPKLNRPCFRITK